MKRRQEEQKKHDIDTSTASTKSGNGTIQALKNKQLPSRREEIRWRISKYMNQVMDDLMPKLAVASQRINTYTGTDYSAIESLRREIRSQESLVKARHEALLTAKESLESARTAESLSRKEVVALLERRHSWSDTDLERYMSLIRSEHLNDQAVQSAKDAVTAAEQSLDEARNKMEKMERMQYHEEQIWSDTIRRNSTWVTFGLMGVNILLLLVTMGVVEPWRRKRMVREIKAAMEEKITVPAPVTTTAAIPIAAEPIEIPSTQQTVKEEEVKQDIDQVVEPVAVPLETVEEIPAAENASPSATNISAPTTKLRDLEATVTDLFSERIVSLRQKDVSTIALEGAAAGALLTAILMALLRPR